MKQPRKGAHIEVNGPATKRKGERIFELGGPAENKEGKTMGKELSRGEKLKSVIGPDIGATPSFRGKGRARQGGDQLKKGQKKFKKIDDSHRPQRSDAPQRVAAALE